MKLILSLSLLFIAICSCTQNKQTPNESVKIINGMSFSSLTLPNQLEVLLVSDARFKKSSAAMAVMVGSLEDPLNAQGLAHYLEHMLFLGTKEFPKADEYSTYMEMNGGWDNAYTSDEITNYMFEVDHAAIEGALHRFSRFFVSPSFDAQYLEREKNAVNSEFEKNLKSDGWRQDRYVSTLSKPDHPYSKFSTGNTKTLAGVGRPEVINFYRKYYSSNNMKLVIMSAEPLNKLRDWTKKYFTDVPNFNSVKPKYDTFFFSKTATNRLHFIKTIDDSDDLTILFNYEDYVPYWKSKPLDIIARLLGDEGKGSLLSYLKKKGWALGLQAGPSFWQTFGVEVTLTPEGRKNYDKVAAAVFAFIETIKQAGYPEYIFQDGKAMSKIDFENLEPSASGNRAASFAKGMTDYPVNEFLERKFLLHEYSVEDFKKFLAYLDVNNSHIIVSSKNEKTDKKEDIFGVEYRQEAYSPELLAEFKTPLNGVFSYPEKNKYIPTDFSLVSKNILGPVEETELSGAQPLFIQQDTELGIARGIVLMKLTSNVENNPKNGLLAHLYTVCKEEELKEWSAPILDARVDYNLSAKFPDTMMLSISGYSHRLLTTIKDVIVDKENNRRLDRCLIDESLFVKIKEKIKKNIENKEEDVAFQRISEELGIFAIDKSIHWREVLPLIEKVTLAEVQKFGEQFFKEINITTLAYGNVKVDEIKSIPIFLEESLGSKVYDRALADKRDFLYRTVPAGKEYSLVVKGRNNNYASSAIYNLGPWNIADHAKVILLSQLISQPYFSELRTNQQLGYVARSGPNYNGFVGITGTLQSPKYSSEILQQKSNKFISEFLKDLVKNLDDEKIKTVVAASINELLTKPNTLNERFAQFQAGATTYGGQFDVRKKLAEELKKMKAQDLKDFVQQKFFDTKPGVLTAYYYGKGAKIPKKLPGKTFEKASDVKDWIYLNPFKKKEETK